MSDFVKDKISRLRPSIDALREPDLISRGREEVQSAFANAMQIAIRRLGGREYLTPNDRRIENHILAMIEREIVPISVADGGYSPQTHPQVPASVHLELMEGLQRLIDDRMPPKTLPAAAGLAGAAEAPAAAEPAAETKG